MFPEIQIEFSDVIVKILLNCKVETRIKLLSQLKDLIDSNPQFSISKEEIESALKEFPEELRNSFAEVFLVD